MKPSAIKLLILFICCARMAYAAQNEEVYIKEYASKKGDVAPITFLLTKDSLIISEVSFKVYYSNNAITQITRTDNNKHLVYTRLKDGNIADEHDHRFPVLGYTSAWLARHNAFSNVYPMLHANYLQLTNAEKLRILEALAEKYPPLHSKRKSSR